MSTYIAVSSSSSDPCTSEENTIGPTRFLESISSGCGPHCSKEKKLLKSMKFPKEYDQKIPLKKIKWEVMKTWIATRVTELLGVEDEVLIGYIYEQLEGQDVSRSTYWPTKFNPGGV